jgi:hypothetical protein
MSFAGDNGVALRKRVAYSSSASVVEAPTPLSGTPPPAAMRTNPKIADFHLYRRRGWRMWETCSVQLSVRLPRDIAEQAEEVQKNDPEFLSRIVLYGLTRRSIYRHLREQGRHDTTLDTDLSQLAT